MEQLPILFYNVKIFIVENLDSDSQSSYLSNSSPKDRMLYKVKLLGGG